jgi:hypothetical protein
MQHIKRAVFIILIMASLLTIMSCGRGNQAYPNPNQYPYPYTNP